MVRTDGSRVLEGSAVCSSVQTATRGFPPCSARFRKTPRRLHTSGGVLGYNSQLWTNTDLLNPESPEDRPDNAKYQAYLDVPFRRLRACVGSSHGQCIYHSFESPWSSALALFSAGYVRDTSVDQAGMVQAFGATPGSYRTCPMILGCEVFPSRSFGPDWRGWP